LTHYPIDIETSLKITEQEAKFSDTQKLRVELNDWAKTLIEEIAFEARNSEFIDEKSGVSARLTISALENLISAVERRVLINGEKKSHVRVGDFWGIIPAITGKIELVYEGEQEGPFIVAQNLIGKAIGASFNKLFPNPEEFKKKKQANPYQTIIDWFGLGNHFDLMIDLTNDQYSKILMNIKGLNALVKKYHPDADKSTQLFLMEMVLHGLAEHSLLSKGLIQSGFQFKDLFNSMLNFDTDPSEQEWDDFQ